MKLIDPHIHCVSRTTDDYQDMLMVLDIKELQALRKRLGFPILTKHE